MKKKMLIPLIVATALFAVGITLAFMFLKTEPIVNNFITAEVTCSVIESFDNVQKTNIQVKNDSNIACYLRIRLVSYWQNKNGEIVGKPSNIPDIVIGNGWMAGETNDVFYYKTPVEAGKTTDNNLLKEPLVLSKDEHNGETVYQVVKVFAEAIQAEPVEAVKTAWPFFAAGLSE